MTDSADIEEPQGNPDQTGITVPEMRQWLRNWVGKAVGKSPDDIDESVPMVELGLASRDGDRLRPQRLFSWASTATA